MTLDEILEAYVRDVAQALPRPQRDDVALELRVLLGEELTARAHAAGHAPDRALLMAILKEHGRPADVAQRYYPRPALIDPADTRHFLIWALAGLVVLGVRALTGAPAIDDGQTFVLWLGLLLMGFALVGWWRRRHPGTLHWKPRHDAHYMPRWLALFCAAATLIFPLAMYAAPQEFVRTLFLSAIPDDGVMITEAFRHSWQRMLTLACLVVAVLSYLAVAVQGGWRRWSRRISIASYLLLGLLLIAHSQPMSAWPASGSFNVFALPHANLIASPVFGAVGGMVLLFTLYEIWLEWQRPRPASAATASAR